MTLCVAFSDSGRITIMRPRDPLPTDEQKKLLCEMMHRAFVEIRLLGWAGKSAQIADLAEAFHNVPMEMYGWGRWDRRLFRMGLEEYQRKYHHEEHPGVRYDYVWMFDAIFGPG